MFTHPEVSARAKGHFSLLIRVKTVKTLTGLRKNNLLTTGELNMLPACTNLLICIYNGHFHTYMVWWDPLTFTLVRTKVWKVSRIKVQTNWPKCSPTKGGGLSLDQTEPWGQIVCSGRTFFWDGLEFQTNSRKLRKQLALEKWKRFTDLFVAFASDNIDIFEYCSWSWW